MESKAQYFDILGEQNWIFVFGKEYKLAANSIISSSTK